MPTEDIEPIDDAQEDRLEEILMHCLESRERGEEPPIAELCNRNKALQQRVEALLQADDNAMEDLRNRSSVDAQGASSPPRDDTPDDTPDEIGRIGEYEIISLLGAGGMGRVYLAKQASLRRLVALKVFDSSLFADESAMQRFHREAETTAALEHPNIVPIYGVGNEGHQHFIAMRWLTGPGLDAVETPLAPRDAARIGALVARALHQAHSCGVIHRDVKPANLILDDEKPVIVDFGLCKPIDDRSLTGQGVVPGTLPYMPPESFQGAKQAPDPTVDTYGLAATIYELVGGHPPFNSKSTERLIFDIIHEPPPPLRGQIPADLETILLRGLAKTPSQRFSSCLEFAEELERFRDGFPILSRRSGFVERTYRWVLRRRALSLAIGALFVASIAIGLFTMSEMSRQRGFDEGKATLMAAVDRRDQEQCRAVLETLTRQYGESAEELAPLRMSVDRLLVEEQLLDLMMTRRTDISPGVLRNVLAELDRTRGAEEPVRPVRLAIALAALYRGKNEWALEILDQLDRDHGVGRATVALRACATDDPITTSELDLPASEGHPLEYIFTSLAIQVLDNSIDKALDEVERAFAVDPHNTRAKFVRARLIFMNGEYPTARIAFEYLEPAPAQVGAAETFLAWIDLASGNAELALSRLNRIPFDDQNPRTYLLRADALHRLKHPSTEIEDVLNVGLSRWPEDSQLHLYAGALLSQSTADNGAIGRAEEHFRSVVQHGLFNDQTEVAEINLQVLKLRGAPTGTKASGRARQEAASELMRLSSECRSKTARAESLYVIGRLVYEQSRTTAVSQFRKALQINPDHMAARISLASTLHSDEEHKEAIEHALFVVNRENKGTTAPGAKEVTQGLIVAGAALIASGDIKAGRPLLERVQPLLPERSTERAEVDEILAGIKEP